LRGWYISNNSKVVSLRPNVPPKKIEEDYKGQHLIVAFVPATQQWFWTVTVKLSAKYEGVASNMNEALKRAKSRIDELVADE